MLKMCIPMWMDEKGGCTVGAANKTSRNSESDMWFDMR